jgi:hypothetical protein
MRSAPVRFGISVSNSGRPEACNTISDRAMIGLGMLLGWASMVGLGADLLLTAHTKRSADS